jgi:hypothetical protein
MPLCSLRVTRIFLVLRQDAQVITATAASGAQIDCLRWPNTNIELQFANQRVAFRGAFADFSVQADGENLLGRTDFFQSFIVQFWESAQLMNVDLSPDFSSPVIRQP